METPPICKCGMFHFCPNPVPNHALHRLPAPFLLLQSGGVLLTTPERRLSLHLKQQELWEQGQRELVAAMSQLAELPYVDLLDESDELLTHR